MGRNGHINFLLLLKMPVLSVKAPGKTILFGEHAVVYNYPAIAVPINSIQLKINIMPLPDARNELIFIFNMDTKSRYTLQDLSDDHFIKKAINQICAFAGITRLPAMEIQIQSTIPISSGLGSSAAFAVALSKAVLGFLGFNPSLEEINEIAFKIEIHQHGTPSGIDNTVIAYNKPILYQRGHPLALLDIQEPISLVIADSGIHIPTKQTVLEVKKRYQENKKVVENIFEKIGELTTDAVVPLKRGKIIKLGKLMNQNHSLLQKLDVSSKKLDMLVSTALNNHALGAKLCGGGKGGSIVAIAEFNNLEEIRDSLLLAGAVSCFIFRLSPNKNRGKDD